MSRDLKDFLLTLGLALLILLSTLYMMGFFSQGVPTLSTHNPEEISGLADYVYPFLSFVFVFALIGIALIRLLFGRNDD